MKKLILLLLVAMIPFLTMAQKKSKKRSKTDKIANSTGGASAYEFMVIKGAEIDMSKEEGMDEAEKNATTSDVSLERIMKKLVKPPMRLIVSFETADMRGSEVRKLLSKSNEFRTMSAAVKEASLYGWEFINANVFSTKYGIMHYYYMKRNK